MNSTRREPNWTLLYTAYVAICLPLINPPTLFALSGLTLNLLALTVRRQTPANLLRLLGTALCVLTLNAVGLTLAFSLLCLAAGLLVERLLRAGRDLRRVRLAQPTAASPPSDEQVPAPTDPAQPQEQL